MFQLGEIAFGDTVRIIDAAPTRLSGHANLVGSCYGLTTPSVTQVDVLGEALDDVALSVHFESDAVADAWFASRFVKLVDHAVGSQAKVGDHSYVKAPDGEWVEEQPVDRPPARRRKWFRRA